MQVFGAGRYFAPGLPAIITKNIDVEQEEVNGKMCTMVSLSWLPDVEDEVIRKLRRGKLKPRADGLAYRVPPPYSVNVEIIRRDKTKVVVPIRAFNDDSKNNPGFKGPDSVKIDVKHHYVATGFCFTDYKVQGITVEKGDKLVVVLNEQSATMDLATMSVCLSRVTRIEQFFLFLFFGGGGIPGILAFLDELGLVFRKFGIGRDGRIWNNSGSFFWGFSFKKKKDCRR